LTPAGILLSAAPTLCLKRIGKL